MKKNQQAYTHQEEATMEELSFTASHTPTNPSMWIVDSGATSHMVKEEKFFSQNWTIKSVRTPTKVASGEILVSDGRGSIMSETELGQRTITNVLLVPRVDRNLPSVRQWLRNGYKVFVEEGKGITMDKEYKKKT